MSSERILFLGGTGIISAASVREAVARGYDVTVLNRGSAGARELPPDVRALRADLRDPAAVRSALSGQGQFDAVVDVLSFTPADVRSTLDTLEGRFGQHIFISSASAYEKPTRRLPVTEDTPLINPFWEYSRNKAACEAMLFEQHATRDLPVTVVRPSHTYDERTLPTIGQWTDIARMRAGRPVVVHGDGATQWTITHARDAAVGLAGLLANSAAIGQAYTLTGTHAPTWNQIYGWLADAAGVGEPELVHVASETIAAFVPELGPPLLGDFTNSMVFDTSKIRAISPDFHTTVTFDEGARQMIAWRDAHPETQTVDHELDAAFDRMVDHARSAG